MNMSGSINIGNSIVYYETQVKIEIFIDLGYKI